MLTSEFFNNRLTHIESTLVAPASKVANRESLEMSAHSPLRFLSSHLHASISDWALQVGIFSLYRVPFPVHAAANCTGCRIDLLPDEIWDHAMGCKFLRHVTRVTRHERIITALRRVCSQFGIATSDCPDAYVDPAHPKKKPDRIFYCGSTTFVTDVSVVNLTADSFAAANAQDFGISLSQRAARKMTKYEAAAVAQGHVLIPFILSTRGVFHKDAVNLLKKLSKFASWDGTLPAKQRSVQEFFITSASAACCLALFEGNAQIVRQCMRLRSFCMTGQPLLSQQQADRPSQSQGASTRVSSRRLVEI
jgi:hypothetical protein